MAETAKLNTVTSRIHAELVKRPFNSQKTGAQTTKLYREIFWYPIVTVTLGFFVMIVAIIVIMSN